MNGPIIQVEGVERLNYNLQQTRIKQPKGKERMSIYEGWARQVRIGCWATNSFQ